MNQSVIGRIFRAASLDPDFRRLALKDLGVALAQEGFILTDAEMHEMRGLWEPLIPLPERTSRERIAALARSYTR